MATLRIWNRPIDARAVANADCDWPGAAAAFNPTALAALERAPPLPSQTPVRSYSVGGAFLSAGSLPSFDLNGVARADDGFAPPRALDDEDDTVVEAGSSSAVAATPVTRQRQSSDLWRRSSIAESAAEASLDSSFSQQHAARRDLLVCSCAVTDADEFCSGNGTAAPAAAAAAAVASGRTCISCGTRDAVAADHAAAACLCQNGRGWFRPGDSLLFESEIRLVDLEKLRSKVCLDVDSQ